MLFCVDIGNTNLTFGLLDGERMVASYRMTTEIKRTSDEYGMTMVDMLRLAGVTVEELDGVAVSSVVPKIMHSFNNAVKKYLKKEPMIVGPGIRTGISIRYDNPREVGADRIVDAVAGHNIYGGDLLIIDFGTATTFELVDAKGVYYGGCICPGLEISAQALSSRASKLPDIEIRPINSVITSDTISAMQAGVFWGYIGLVEYLVNKFKEESGKELKVIATGGLGRVIYGNTSVIDVYDPDLAFKGLKILFEKNS